MSRKARPINRHVLFDFFQLQHDQPLSGIYWDPSLRLMSKNCILTSVLFFQVATAPR
jgi:hypothetical protein